MFGGYYQNSELTKTVWDGGIYHTGDTRGATSGAITGMSAVRMT